MSGSNCSEIISFPMTSAKTFTSLIKCIDYYMLFLILFNLQNCHVFQIVYEIRMCSVE
jgi:hypothetical protein